MPIAYSIDPKRRLLLSRASGTLTCAEILSGREQLRADPLFNASYHELFDLRAVETIALTPEELDQLARGSVLARGACRAFVVANAEHLTIARQFAQDAIHRGQRVLVFRDASVAEAWLAARRELGGSST